MIRLSPLSVFCTVLLLLGAGLQIRRMRGDRLPLPKVIAETFGALRANAIRFTLLAIAACLPAAIAVYLGEPWRSGPWQPWPDHEELTALLLYATGLVMLPGFFAAGVMAHLRGQVLGQRFHFRAGLGALWCGLRFALFATVLGASAILAGLLLGLFILVPLAALLPIFIAGPLTLAALIGPPLYIATRFFVALPVVVLGQVSVLEGLDRSGTLTRKDLASVGLLIIATLCLLSLGSTLLEHVLPPGAPRYVGHLILTFVLMIPLSAATTVVYARLVGETGTAAAADLAQTFE